MGGEGHTRLYRIMPSSGLESGRVEMLPMHLESALPHQQAAAATLLRQSCADLPYRSYHTTLCRTR